MDAEPARSTGIKAAARGCPGLETAVFATTDAPARILAGGSDDYRTPALSPRQSVAQVRWRPRPPAAAASSTSRREEVASCSLPAPIAAPGSGRRAAFEQQASAGQECGTADDGPALPIAVPARLAVARGVAAFLGMFALLTVLGEMRHAGFDANVGWLDLRPLPAATIRAWLALAGMLLVAFAIRPAQSPAWRGLTTAVVVLLLTASVWNTLHYYGLLRRGGLHSGPAVPFSLHVAVCLVVILAGTRSGPQPSRRPGRDVLLGAMAFVTCCVAFPVAMITCAGRADHRRPADIAVVFGCEVPADGQPSEALSDRVETACRLYHEGLVERLILSGGSGPGRTSQAEAMRKYAVARGIPAEAIDMDPAGVSAAASVQNTAAIFRRTAPGTILAVSHYYHLPRIKLGYRRAGLDVYTVPADQRQPLDRHGWVVLRELAALWRDYLRLAA